MSARPERDACAQHRDLLRAWISLVRDRAKVDAQREHAELADRWERHRARHLEERP